MAMNDSSKKFYITSPIFYPNAKLHLGHAYVMTICDILARYHRLIGDSTFFLTGSDENTAKLIKAATEQGRNVQEYLDEIVKSFGELYTTLEISYDDFIRTTDQQKHWPGAQKLWSKLVQAGDIYKSKYTGLYCIGCETFYTEKDLIDGKCPIHLTVPEKIEEENYFFKLSKYSDKIKKAIESQEMNIVPESRKNEIMALIDRGLDDVSFSRPKKTVPHAIPVPGDEDQVMYVWCDALVNYISALGYGVDEKKFQEFWPANVHVIGKDILRFHAAIWPAMLMAAGIELPKNLLVHGLITSGGHKMSKSLGNVIDPYELIQEYGAEALRYFFAREVSPFEDGDLTRESFKAAYNANLANGIGNLTNRILKLSETHFESAIEIPQGDVPQDFKDALEKFNIKAAADIAWKHIGELDQKIQGTKPFSIVKTDKEAGKAIIHELVLELYTIARMLHPMMPDTSNKIRAAIKENKMPSAPLFVRKD
jgi:methionyl-tRNA synthetase